MKEKQLKVSCGTQKDEHTERKCVKRKVRGKKSHRVKATLHNIFSVPQIELNS
jgi:hypothetical protein